MLVSFEGRHNFYLWPKQENNKQQKKNFYHLVPAAPCSVFID